MRVLLAEDDKKVASHIRNALRQHGYAVDVVHHGDEALALAQSSQFDAIVLDVMMPGRDGLSVLRALRERRIITPVMLLTARGEVSERVEGLRLGADDYLAKPFDMKELMARIDALLRRVPAQAEVVKLDIADLTMDLVARKVVRGGKEIELSPKEFSLLEYLMRNKTKIVSRKQIAEDVWGHHFDAGTNFVDVYINYLRNSIDKAYDKKLIHTVYGQGFVLKEE